MTRTILISGANNGIGLALTQALLDMVDLFAALDLSLENLSRNSNLRVPMGKLMSKLSDKARQNQIKS